MNLKSTTAYGGGPERSDRYISTHKYVSVVVVLFFAISKNTRSCIARLFTIAYIHCPHVLHLKADMVLCYTFKIARAHGSSFSIMHVFVQPTQCPLLHLLQQTRACLNYTYITGRGHEIKFDYSCRCYAWVLINLPYLLQSYNCIKL